MGSIQSELQSKLKLEETQPTPRPSFEWVRPADAPFRGSCFVSIGTDRLTCLLPSFEKDIDTQSWKLSYVDSGETGRLAVRRSPAGPMMRSADLGRCKLEFTYRTGVPLKIPRAMLGKSLRVTRVEQWPDQLVVFWTVEGERQTRAVRTHPVRHGGHQKQPPRFVPPEQREVISGGVSTRIVVSAVDVPPTEDEVRIALRTINRFLLANAGSAYLEQANGEGGDGHPYIKIMKVLE